MIESPLLTPIQAEYERQQAEQARQEQKRQEQARQAARIRAQVARVRDAETVKLLITRQQFLKWTGFGGGGLIVALVGNQIVLRQQPSQPTPAEPQPTSVAKPKVTAANAGAAKVSGLPLWTEEFETVLVDARGQVNQRRSRQAKFAKEPLGNGIELELVSIAAGSFQMGSPNTEAESTDDERPQHPVTLKSFLMGKYPVTQAQWKAVAALPKISLGLKPDPSDFKGVLRPVEQVSWQEAVEFCARLAKKTGRNYRLPSEAEWEYACRGGTTTPFYFGETISTDLANYQGGDWTSQSKTYSNSYGKGLKGITRGQPIDVGSFPPNAFGLYDMHGNVWECCADYWHGSYAGAPTDGTPWIAGGDSEKRVRRGGSWFSNPAGCRAANRSYVAPAVRDYGLGLRVVCSVFPELL